MKQIKIITILIFLLSFSAFSLKSLAISDKDKDVAKNPSH